MDNMFENIAPSISKFTSECVPVGKHGVIDLSFWKMRYPKQEPLNLHQLKWNTPSAVVLKLNVN